MRMSSFVGGLIVGAFGMRYVMQHGLPSAEKVKETVRGATDKVRVAVDKVKESRASFTDEDEREGDDAPSPATV